MNLHPVPRILRRPLTTLAALVLLVLTSSGFRCADDSDAGSPPDRPDANLVDASVG